MTFADQSDSAESEWRKRRLVRGRARDIERDLELRGEGEAGKGEQALVVVGCSVVASLDSGDAELGSEGRGKDGDIEVEGEESEEVGRE